MTNPRKPRDPNAVAWSTLATWSDENVLSYFTNTRGHDEKHARNSLRFLRSKFPGVIPGSAQPGPAPASFAPFKHAAPVIPAQFVPSQPQAPTLPVYTAPSVPPMPPAKIPEPPAGDGLAGLAAMLAPHLASLVAGNVAHRIQERVDASVQLMDEHINARLEAIKEPPTKLIVINPPAEPKPLEGIHHEMAPKLIALASQGLNVMMIGPAGCGKTVLAKSVAQAQNKRLTVVSCSAGMSEAQLLGRLLPLGANGSFKYVESPFMKAYANGGVILLDEMDAADANLLLVINAALANGGIEIEARAASGLDTLVHRHPETVILAAANTWGGGADTQYVGRGALDVSTLDRFYRLAVDYDTRLERQLASLVVVERVQTLRMHARNAKLRRVVSTRMIVRVEAAMRAGLSHNDAMQDELASWSKDERIKGGEG